MKLGCYHHTEEAKAKISLAMRGNKYSLGYRHTEETKAKIRQGNLGKYVSEEAKAKISKAGMGNKRTLGYHHHTGETKAKIRRTKLGKISTEETKAKMSRVHKVKWQDSEYRDRSIRAMRLGCLVHPNKPETVLLALLESAYPGEWIFVGDGTLIIDGFNPDFVNANGKKQIIEMFGQYWHGKGLKPNRRSDTARVRAYASLGYDTLIIWECELKYPDKVLEKIAEFIKTPLRAE